jgi:pyrroloquinoline quinone (PQQ) biosynthesis protein C
MGWKDWRLWEELHAKWVDIYGEKVRFNRESLKAVYEWFIREAGDRDVDALHIDLLLEPSMTYEDAKKVLKSVLEKPLSVQEFNELIEERMRQLKEEVKELKGE